MSPAPLAVTSLALYFFACEAALSKKQSELGDRNKHGEPLKRHLRLCNAYPHESALQVHIDKRRDLTKDGPMPYKSCKEFLTQLYPGDRLEFSVGEAKAGYFLIGDLPKKDATLFLVIYRHDPLSTAASFKSHVFANVDAPQVLLVDGFQGGHKVKARVFQPSVPLNGSTPIQFGGIKALTPGKYQVNLDSINGTTEVSSSFVALSKENYVLLRTGVEPESGPAFPQSLVVFPESTESLWSGARPTRTATAVQLMSLLTAMVPLAAIMDLSFA